MCDEMFRDGVNVGDMIDCNFGGTGIVGEIVDLIDELDDTGATPQIVSYNSARDEVRFIPTNIPYLGDYLPEMDITFGRLTKDEILPPTLNGTTLIIKGKEDLFLKGRVDAFSFLRYAVPDDVLDGLLLIGIEIGAEYISFGPFKSTAYGPTVDPKYLSIDVADINLGLRSSFEATYTYTPEIKLKGMDLGQPMSWSLPGTLPLREGTSQVINDVAIDQTIRLVIPDGQTEDMFISNVYSAEGSFIADNYNKYFIDFGINLFEFTGSIFGGSTVGPLIDLDPLFSIPWGNKQVQYANESLLFPDVAGSFILDPDDIPPVTFCNDTLVYLDEYGLAFIDLMTAFDEVNSYDLPLLGTGTVIPVDVFPDTIVCEDYPETIGYLVTTDDNCNYDTCEFIITVRDTMRPHMGCVEIVASLGADGTYEIEADEIAIGAVDNCRFLEAEVIPPVLYCEDAGTLVDVTVRVTDIAGNMNECVVDVSVIDTIPPEFACVDDLVENTDPGYCSAVVNHIGPTTLSDNCEDHVAVVWQTEYPAGSGIITQSGVENASGEVFQEGVSKVFYRAQDQPLVLLSEITHELEITDGGMTTFPHPVVTNDDYVEITNLGPAAMNLTGLVLERVTANISETYQIPDSTILDVGRVLVVHFGDGTDYPAALFYNVPGTTDLDTGTPAAYLLSFEERIIDVVAVNGFDPVGQGQEVAASGTDWAQSIPSMEEKGGVIRRFSFDNNHAKDWRVAQVCSPITMGKVNPEMEIMPNNGSISAFQSIAPNTVHCDFTITVIDQELPTCGQFAVNDYNSATELGIPGSITGGTIYTSTILVPDNFRVGEVALLNVQGNHPDVSDLHFKLRGPNGHEVSLFHGLCPGEADFDFNIGNDTLPLIDLAACGPLGQGGWYTTVDDINTVNTGFYGIQSIGNWTLIICDANAANSGQLNNWELRLFEIQPYDQDNVVVPNDPGDCGALFTWTHPRLIDNCQEGITLLKYVTYDDIEVPESPGVIEVATELTEYFHVGNTIVRYVMTDGSGNIDSCDFNVQVVDAEPPSVICPADQTIYLDGGECREQVCFEPVYTWDNCEVVDTQYSIEPCSFFEIGTTTVVIVVFDQAGLSDTCSFDIHIVENEVDDFDLSCNDLINVSLDADCEALITADMVLEGDDYGCYENYQISITDMLGIEIESSPVVTIEHLDMALMYTVFDPASGNSCMGLLNVEKKLIPEIACPPDTAIYCNVDPLATGTDGVLLTGTIELLTCEGSVTITHSDDLVDNGDCGDPRVHIERTFYLTNASNITVSCVQNIVIMPFSLDQITFPNDVVLECSEVGDIPALTEPANTGYPELNGQSITILEPLCNLSYSYHDELFNICPDSYEILRVWKVRNRCEGLSDDNPRVHTQIIEVLDVEGPDMHYCEDLVILNASPYECEASGFLPVPMQIEDACSTVDFDAKIFGNGFLHITGSLETGDLKVAVSKLDKNSNSLVRYIVTDACGNRTLCEFHIEVEDIAPPIAVCEQFKQVTLTQTGDATIAAVDFDSGSYDNCNPVFFKVRRDDDGCPDLNGDDNESIGGNQIYFDDRAYYCCEDLALTEPIMTTLRVYEVDPGPGPVHPSREAPGGDLYGRFMDCMSQVTVESKLPPVLACEDKFITCEESKDPYINPNLGVPEVSSVCGIYTLEYEDNNSNLDPCGMGYLTRIWRVLENGEVRNTCVQRIHIVESMVFDPTTIVFPRETEYSCLVDLQNGAGPTFDENPCNIVTAELIHTDTLPFADDACYKIFRKWAVMDWCTYDGNQGAETNVDGFITLAGGAKAKLDPNHFVEDGYYVFTETIKIIDVTAPEIEVENACFATATCVTQPETHSLQAHAFETDEDCGGEYVWKYVIHDLGTWDVIQFSHNNLDYQGDNYEGGLKGKASRDVLMNTETAELLILPSLAVGKYQVTWTAGDGCGNAAQTYQFFDVADKKPPTPFMVDISTALMTNCMVELWAIGFDKGACDGTCLASFDNCSDQLFFTYTATLPQLDASWQLDHHGLYYYDPDTGAKSTREKYLFGEALSWDPLRNTSGRIFGIDRDGNPPELEQSVAVFVWDKFGYDENCDDGNYDYATIVLRLNDEGDDCGQGSFAAVSGSIQEVRSGMPIDQVQVTIDRDSPEYPKHVIANGTYSFSGLSLGEYEITAGKNDDYPNGVSTLDLLHIQRHILGIKALDDVYDLIAADANESGSISAGDIFVLRELILLVTDELSKGPSWRMIDPDYHFSDPFSPWNELSEAERIFVTAFSDIYHADLAGIKIGDLNQSIGLNGYTHGLDPRSSEPLSVIIQDRYCDNGPLAIPVLAGESALLFGMQGALFCPNLALEGVESGSIPVQMQHFGTKVAGHITFSIDVPKGMEVEEGDVLFTLYVRSGTKAWLSQLIDMINTLTMPEIYTAPSLTTHPLSLEFRGDDMHRFQVMQNEPNPFMNSTSLAFSIPDKGNVTLEVVNLSGETVIRKSQEFDRGLHQWTLNNKDIGPGGVYFYTISFGDESVTRKMILIK
jgi:hypothetical protein